MSSNPLMVTRFPGKALCSASPSVVVGRLTVIEDCSGTNTELKLLKWKWGDLGKTLCTHIYMYFFNYI